MLGVRAERGGERFHPIALDLDARGRAVAAEAKQMLGARAQAGEQIKALDAAPRPLSSAFA